MMVYYLNKNLIYIPLIILQTKQNQINIRILKISKIP